MRNLATFGICTLLCCSLTACTNTQQASNLERYTLTQEVAPQVFMSQQDVNVKLASALEMSGVMIELSDISLRPAQNFRYVDDLDKELRLLTINQYLQKDFPKNYHTAIFVSKFQGTLDGQTKVWAYIEVRNHRNKLVFRDEFKRENKINSDGYDSLVQGLKDTYISIIDEVILKVMEK